MFVDKLGLWSDVDLCWQKDKDLWKVKGKRSYCVFQSLIQSCILACSFLSGGMSFGSVTNDSIKSLSSSYEMFVKCRQLVNALCRTAQNCFTSDMSSIVFCVCGSSLPATPGSCQNELIKI